jgi:hypothetical protein
MHTVASVIAFVGAASDACCFVVPARQAGRLFFWINELCDERQGLPRGLADAAPEHRLLTFNTDPGTMTEVERLAQFAVRARYQDLSANARHELKRDPHQSPGVRRVRAPLWQNGR